MFKIIYRALKLFKKEKKVFYTLIVANFLFAILILVEPIIYWSIIDTLISFSKELTNNIISFI